MNVTCDLQQHITNSDIHDDGYSWRKWRLQALLMRNILFLQLLPWTLLTASRF